MNIHKNAKLTPLGRERRVNLPAAGRDDAGRTHAYQGRCPCRCVPRHGKEMAGEVLGRRVGRTARPFLKAENLAPAHPGPNHPADYRLAASTADLPAAGRPAGISLKRSACPPPPLLRRAQQPQPGADLPAAGRNGPACRESKTSNRLSPRGARRLVPDLPAAGRRRSTPYIPVGVCP